MPSNDSLIHVSQLYIPLCTFYKSNSIYCTYTLLQIVFEFTIVETQFLFLFFTTEEIFTKRIYIILGILKRTIKNPHKKVEHCVKETISAHYCIRYTYKDLMRKRTKISNK